jgi:hypothetical protein
MSPAFRNALLWLLASVAMVVAALSSVSDSFVDGHYIPNNEDAFYHARRILDSVMNHAPILQFDSKIHAPQGSWITWPWGFDTLLATITGWFGPYADINAANKVLMNLPPMISPLAVLLVIVIARQVKLAFWQSALLTLAFALLPAAFRAFCVGNVDHHFMELLCTLGTFAAGAWFFREGNRSIAAPIALGALLGGMVAMQNGLFVLQVPVCAMLTLRWLRGQSLPDRRQILVFAVTLVVATLAACLPSEPFRRGFFEFYTLSGFHLYVSALVAVFSVLLSRVSFSPRHLALLIVLALVALIPFFGALYFASSFVTGNLASITTIAEAQNPYRLYLNDPDGNALLFMSWLMWLMMPMLLVNVWWAWRKSDPVLQFVAIMSVFGLAFFQMQYRFGVFGLLPMLLTPVMFAKELIAARPGWRRYVAVLMPVMFIGAFAPTKNAWSTKLVLANHLSYDNIHSAWPRFAELCRERPGLALADVEAGHWIRYHTDCSVIADVFLLTPQHLAKVDENTHLLEMTPKKLLTERKDIRYVLVFHGVLIRNGKDGGEYPVLEALRQDMLPMERELLGPETAIPPQFKKRWEVRSPKGQIYSRLYEVVRE